MLTLYNALLLPLRLALGVWAGIQAIRGRGTEEWDERLGRRLPQLRPNGLWIHGASVGEVRIVKGLLRRLRAVHPDLTVAVSAYTATGRVGLPAPPAVDAAFFLAADFPGAIRRQVAAVRPRAMVLVETELWPNLLRHLHAEQVPTILINGRLSASRMDRYRRLGRLYRPLLGRLDRVGAQTPADALRFAELGVPERAIEVTGNVKYDLPAPTVDREAWRRRLALPEETPVLVAGSTAEGEDEPVLGAWAAARERIPDLRLILAPRHPERFDAVAEQVSGRGLALARMSSLERAPERPWEVLLVDSLGQLGELYGLGRAAFVGGSLVPVGGHNLLEPAIVGAPVLFGPHLDNVTLMSKELLQAGAAIRVEDGAGLARALVRLLTTEDVRKRQIEAADAVIERNRGALDRSVRLIQRLLETGR